MTRHEDCVAVNRDAQRFSSYRKGTFLWETPEDQLEEQRLMMVTMDPPIHTRYRRLVNKGFTPRMIGELQQTIHGVADEIIDRICEAGSADFVIDVAAELPLIVLAELLGVPAEDRSKMFDWSNRMIGRERCGVPGDAGRGRGERGIGRSGALRVRGRALRAEADQSGRVTS